MGQTPLEDRLDSALAKRTKRRTPGASTEPATCGSGQKASQRGRARRSRVTPFRSLSPRNWCFPAPFRATLATSFGFSTQGRRRQDLAAGMILASHPARFGKRRQSANSACARRPARNIAPLPRSPPCRRAEFGHVSGAVTYFEHGYSIEDLGGAIWVAWRASWRA